MKGSALRCRLVLLAALGGTLATRGAQASLGAEVESNEAMMTYQGALLLTLGNLLPPESATTLNFYSSVDAVAETFSFSLVAGQSFRGVPLTMTGSGAYNSVEGSWDMVSSASAGGGSWTSSGSLTFSGDPGADGTIDSFFDVFFELTTHTTTIENVTYEQTGARTASTGTIVTDKGQPGETKQPAHDVYNTQGPDKGKWTWTADEPEPKKPSVKEHTTGYSPEGGPGTFQTTLEPVPEPFTALVLASGLGLLFARRRKAARP